MADTTIDILRQAVAAAEQDQRVISTLGARIKELEGQQPPPPDPIPSGWPVAPQAPVIPPSSQMNRTAGVKVSTNMDANGTTYIHTPENNWTPLFELNKQGAGIRRVRMKTTPRGADNKPVGANGIIIAAAGCIAEDIDVLDNSAWGVLVRANGAIIRRMRCRSVSEYPIYIEGADNTTLEDFDCYDDGGTPNDPSDDDGGSWAESVIRLSNAGTLTMRRCRVIYRGKNRKACLRGDGDVLGFDCEFDGAAIANNPLDGGDGGRGWLLDRVHIFAKPYIVRADNEVDTTAAVRKAIAGGERNEEKLARIFRDTGRFTVNNAPYKPTDAEVAFTLERRKKDIGQNGTLTLVRSTLRFGLGVKAGCITKLKACKIYGTAENRGMIFGPIDPAREYPEPAWRYPEDPYRPEQLIELEDVEMFGELGLSDTDFARIVRMSGSVKLNGVRLS
jgi:hypothetical protein